jgi:hypothetical protein
MPSGSWSKQKPSISPGFGRLIDPANTLILGSEPDPVFCVTPFFAFLIVSGGGWA